MVQDQKAPGIPSVTVVGVGGLGSPVCLTLAKQGYGLTLYDPDKVEEKNILNQLYGVQELGQKKVVAMEDMLRNLAPEATVNTRRCAVSRQTTFYTPVVVCCVDSLQARKEVFNACKRSNRVRLLVDGRLGGTTVKVLALNPHHRADAKAYQATLEGEVVLGCAQRFEGHIALIGAGLVVRAMKMALEEESVERLLVFETRGFHILKDGPHPLGEK